MRKNKRVTTDEAAELNPKVKIVAVLDDITRWRPSPATAGHPHCGAPLRAVPRRDLAASRAGQRDARFAAEHSDLMPARGGVRDVEQFGKKIDAVTPGD
ncbi:hypothetical protein [Thermomonospora umbrina]|uniref:Uncharacterized protein n=1 Tax=Thermomonospora umbrina TaxID=111806 RepID=A0A3D9SH23_9ACTN|nr:hypothetical protein [Thermomonospora umbrina]REE95202.1 hypothetical protein DFJ69_0585 [Thermomonospora umbrina]